jgi:lipopolysaccharide/colanic/teichoic acid biosynthesis glycosyltransferase
MNICIASTNQKSDVHNKQMKKEYFLKRTFDVVFSAVLIIAVSPVLVITYCLLRCTDKQVFFLQKRTGKNGRKFTLLKFRTMKSHKSKSGKILSDAERVMVMGGFLRKSSIDELPQLINILKGDMSLVGPRPLLPEYLPLYNTRQAKRHDVKPGITGWAQVNGRNAISWEEKFEYDLWYVENIGLGLDIKILVKTFLVVLGRKGINAANTIPMEKFKGSS